MHETSEIKFISDAMAREIVRDTTDLIPAIRPVIEEATRRDGLFMGRLIRCVNGLMYVLTMAKTVESDVAFGGVLERFRGSLAGPAPVREVLSSIVRADAMIEDPIDRLLPGERLLARREYLERCIAGGGA